MKENLEGQEAEFMVNEGSSREPVMIFAEDAAGGAVF